MIRTPLAFLLLPVMFLAQASLAQDQADQDKAMCQYAADHMIEIAKQSLNEKSSRPERIEQRRKLVEEWSARMENGEDPCSVYADIQKAATTF